MRRMSIETPRPAWASLATRSLIGSIVLAALGCSDRMYDQPLGEQTASTYLPATSPENVLHNLERAYRQQDIESYLAVRDPAYRSVPSPSSSIDRFQFELGDSASTARLFEAADDITLRFVFAPSQPSLWPEYPASEGYRQVVVSSGSLDILKRRFVLDSNEPITIRRAFEPFEVIFKPDRASEPLAYTIVHTRTLPALARASRSITGGRPS